MKELLFSMLNVIYRSDYMANASDYLILSSPHVKQLFTFVYGTNLDGNGGVYAIIKPLSMWLLIIVLLVSILEKFGSESFTSQSLLKPAVGFVGSLAVIQFLPRILLSIVTIGNSLALTLLKTVGNLGIGGGGTISEAELQTVVDKVFASGNFFNNIMSQLGGVIGLFIPWIVSYATVIILNCVMLSRVLEICIYGAMSPIAVVDISRGYSSSGMRFLKTFFAISLQSTIIILISHLTSFFTGSMLNIANPSLGNLIGTSFANLVLPICGIMMMLKSNPKAREIMGV